MEVIIILWMWLIYFMPAIIATNRWSINMGLVWILNITLAWTWVIWLACIFLAVWKTTQEVKEQKELLSLLKNK